MTMSHHDKAEVICSQVVLCLIVDTENTRWQVSVDICPSGFPFSPQQNLKSCSLHVPTNGNKCQRNVKYLDIKMDNICFCLCDCDCKCTSFIFIVLIFWTPSKNNYTTQMTQQLVSDSLVQPMPKPAKISQLHWWQTLPFTVVLVGEISSEPPVII